MEKQNNKIEDTGSLMGENKEYKVGNKKPPLETRFKKGYDPRRYTRQKGDVNCSTVPLYVLRMMVKPPEEMLGDLKAMYPKFFEGKSQKWQTEFIMTIRLAQKALLEGDVQAYNALMEKAYGKMRDDINLKIDAEIKVDGLDYERKLIDIYYLIELR